MTRGIPPIYQMKVLGPHSSRPGDMRVQIETAPFSGWVEKKFTLPVKVLDQILTSPIDSARRAGYHVVHLIEYLENAFPERAGQLREQYGVGVHRPESVFVYGRD